VHHARAGRVAFTEHLEPLPMKTGSTVRLIQPVIEGVVKERRIVGDEIECLVAWEEDGQTVERWFAESQLEPVKEAA
jgi:hypothetical protein